MELAELEYLNGNLDESEKISLEALQNTDNDLIKAYFAGGRKRKDATIIPR